MEIKRLTTKKLENGVIRFIGYDDESDIILMYDCNPSYIIEMIDITKRNMNSRAEFMFSAELEFKLFKDEKSYPVGVSTGFKLGRSQNYFKDSFMYFVCDTQTALKVLLPS